MPRAIELIQVYAETLGFEDTHVALTARRLRENELFIAETKSPRSWRLSPLDAASLLVGLLSSQEALRAPRDVMLAAQMELLDKSLEHARETLEHHPKLPRWVAQIIEEGEVTFLRAIEIIIFNAMADPNGFAKRFEYSTIEICPSAQEASLYANATSLLATPFEPEINLKFFGDYDASSRRDAHFLGRASWKAIAAAAKVLTGIH